MQPIEKDRFDSSLYDQRHGGPFDRGGADYYYGRAFDPHYFVGATYDSDRVELKDMTPEEIAAYTRGFNAAEEEGTQKDWG
jgi:hypothetical protein